MKMNNNPHTNPDFEDLFGPHSYTNGMAGHPNDSFRNTSFDFQDMTEAYYRSIQERQRQVRGNRPQKMNIHQIHFANQHNPATIRFREHLLKFAEMNFHGLSQNYWRYALLSHEEAMSTGIDTRKFKHLKMLWKRYQKMYYNAGGDLEDLVFAVQMGGEHEETMLEEVRGDDHQQPDNDIVGRDWLKLAEGGMMAFSKLLNQLGRLVPVIPMEQFAMPEREIMGGLEESEVIEGIAGSEFHPEHEESPGIAESNESVEGEDAGDELRATEAAEQNDDSPSPNGAPRKLGWQSLLFWGGIIAAGIWLFQQAGAARHAEAA